MNYQQIVELIGKDAGYVLPHRCKTIGKEKLYLPGSDFIGRICMGSTRNIQTLCRLNTIFKFGRLAGTGYLSVLPVGQGLEHSAGGSFGSYSFYFDPENITSKKL